jgi:carboxymethylenebutenolidase
MSDFPDKTSAVSFASENKAGACPGALCVTESGNKQFAVVVLQEWWGMNSQIKELSTKLTATYGFTTIIPDLYRGQVAVDHEHAGHLMNGLDWVRLACCLHAFRCTTMPPIAAACRCI